VRIVDLAACYNGCEMNNFRGDMGSIKHQGKTRMMWIYDTTAYKRSINETAISIIAANEIHGALSKHCNPQCLNKLFV